MLLFEQHGHLDDKCLYASLTGSNSSFEFKGRVMRNLLSVTVTVTGDI